MAYIGKSPVIGNFVKLDAITAVNGQAAYTMQNGGSNFTDYESVNQFLVSLNGTIQAPTDSFTVSGSTLTFASNLSTGDVIDFIIVFGNSLSAGTPTDATVSTAKIVDDAVTAAKINNDIISGSTELASEPADTDEFLVSDAGTLKRIDYSFIKPSSDFVLLSSTTPSAANTFSIDGHFTSDYDIYKIYAIGMSGSSMSNTRLSFRVNVSGTAQTGGSYYFQTVNSSKTTLAVWADNTGGTSADLGYIHSSTGSTKQGHLEMTIFRPLGTDVTGMFHEMLAWDNGTDGGKYMGSTFYNVATAISGITLGCGAFGSGNLEADRILVYGMKNS